MQNLALADLLPPPLPQEEPITFGKLRRDFKFMKDKRDDTLDGKRAVVPATASRPSAAVGARGLG